MAVVDTGDFRRLIKNRLLVRSCLNCKRVAVSRHNHQEQMLQGEMLGSIAAAGAADWSVLIMDAVSTRVMSHSCQISEILDYGISCKELQSAKVVLESLGSL